MKMNIPEALQERISLTVRQLARNPTIIDSLQQAQAIQRLNPDFQVSIDDIAAEFEHQAAIAGIPMLMSRGDPSS